MRRCHRDRLRPVEEHLRLCPDCAEEYAVMREALSELGEPGSRSDPSGAWAGMDSGEPRDIECVR